MKTEEGFLLKDALTKIFVKLPSKAWFEYENKCQACGADSYEVDDIEYSFQYGFKGGELIILFNKSSVNCICEKRFSIERCDCDWLSFTESDHSDLYKEVALKYKDVAHIMQQLELFN